MGSWYDEQREAQARAYDRAQGVLFIVRFALLFVLATVFWRSGWSRELAAGLRAGVSFPFGWALVHGVFVALAVFGYEAVLFPLSVMADYSLERVHGQLHIGFGLWLSGYLLSLVLEMGLATAGFTGVYVLLRLFPSTWWIWATAAYALLVGGLGEWGPSQLLPRVRPPVPTNDEALAGDLQRIGRAARLEINGVAWWDFEHQDGIEDVRLTGAGRQRRVVFSEWAWRKLEPREQVFLAARHMAWHRHGAAWAVQALQVALAAGVFLGAVALADALARAAGLSGAAEPAAFPLLVMALFGCAALAGLAAHAVMRWLELRADRFALEHAGGPDVLQACLQKQFLREPFALDAPLWQVLLLHRMPTPASRLAQATAFVDNKCS